jgi:uncharacterized glyoxalase superfamily protein PhnB
MISNRSVPRPSVIPELAYADVAEATTWLCTAFGFKERLRIGAHRAQLTYRDGAVIVTQIGATELMAADPLTHSVLVRIEDADGHHAQAARHGARILQPPTDHPFGERQYTAEDLGGHRWTFSQSIEDVDPMSWGGTPSNLE